MLTRREALALSLGAAAAAALPRNLFAAADRNLIRRRIPSSANETLPVIGLGSSATFAQVARSEDSTALREVMQAMIKEGATVIDTAPAYGASEQVAGAIAKELGVAEKIFWATKLNVAPRGGVADASAARAQVEKSFERLNKPKIDLIQVHNLADMPTHLPILKEQRAKGRVRYIGVTTTSERQYPELEQVMKNEPIDFIGIDYAIDNRTIEESILPLAQERKIGVLVYLPFGRTRLFQRVAGRDVPEWAREFDATTWAQFFLKYIVAHPAVTVVTPATSKAKHMLDNIGGGIGKLPDAAMRKRMVELIDSIPAANA